MGTEKVAIKQQSQAIGEAPIPLVIVSFWDKNRDELDAPWKKVTA